MNGPRARRRWPWRLAIGGSAGLLSLGFLGYILAIPPRPADAEPVSAALPTPAPTQAPTAVPTTTPVPGATPRPAATATATPAGSSVTQPAATATPRPRTNTRTRAS